MSPEQEPNASAWLQSRGFVEAAPDARPSESRPAGFWQLFYLVGIGLAGSAAVVTDGRLDLSYRLAGAVVLVVVLARSSVLVVRVVRRRREWWG